MADLTAGALDRMITSEVVKDPILCVLSFKNVPCTAPGASPRYRLSLSDGVQNVTFVMLAQQLNHLIDEGKLKENTVVKVKKYICNRSVNNKNVIIIIDLEVVGYGHDAGVVQSSVVNKPNAPICVPESPEGTNLPSVSKKVENVEPAAIKARTNNKPVTPNPVSTQVKQITLPIISITPYQNRWTIKGCCSQKSQIRTWNNARGEGKLFSFSMSDESGEIRVTAFNKEVDTFFDVIQLNKAYYLTRALVKTANKQFNPTNHEYELTLSHDSQINECQDDPSISDLPSTRFNFVRIAELDKYPPNNLVDVVGVVHECSATTEILAKASQRTIRKRDLVIVDESLCQINLTLWGMEADSYDVHASGHPIIVLKAAKISDFNGRSLSTVSNSTFIVDPPNVPEALRLRNWYDNAGCHTSFESFKSADGGLGNAGRGISQWHSLEYLKSGGVGVNDKPDYITCKAQVVMIKKENCMYKACSSDNCNKKVVVQGNGYYRCEKCNIETTNYKWRILLQMSIADPTTNQWITCFQDQGEAILKRSADQMGALKEAEDENELDSVFQEAYFEPFVFRLRAKLETYNDERRLKVVAFEAKPVNYNEYNKILLAQIKEMLPTV